MGYRNAPQKTHLILVSFPLNKINIVFTIGCCLSMEASNKSKIHDKTWKQVLSNPRWYGYSYYGKGGARGIMVIVVGNGYGDTSSNPRRDWLHFT